MEGEDLKLGRSLCERPSSPGSSILEIATEDGSKCKMKVLEEDDYLDRMSAIIKRDFFPHMDNTERSQDLNSRYLGETPGTPASWFSTSESVGSRQESCALRLNEFLERYTNEDNAYFEKMQKKDMKKHRAKYPWLYKSLEANDIEAQLKLPSIEEQASADNSSNKKIVSWRYNPKNALFYPPNENHSRNRSSSTINYNSNKYSREPIFKVPVTPNSDYRPVVMSRFKDKIGVDGKLLDGSETPKINGYSYIPAPETPIPSIATTSVKVESDNFYLPSQSPRDELAHKLYEKRVAKAIRTPKIKTLTQRTPSFSPIQTRRDHMDLVFSERRNSKRKL